MRVDPAEFLQSLLRCRSVTPADDGAIELVARTLEGIGFTCERLTFESAGTAPIANLAATIGSGSPHLCFAGHTDVVPPGREEAWSAAPFAGTVTDGVLVGRGAVDMKGAIAAFIAAASRYLDDHPLTTGALSLLITGDEEGEAVNGTCRLVDWAVERGIVYDACLVGEPTSAEALGDTIKIGRRGSLNATLTVRGIGGHTAYPHLADNPAHRLVAMLHHLTETPLDAGTPDFQPSTLQISSIDIGNPANNVIPAEATARCNIRFNDRWTGAALEENLRRRLAAFGGDWDLAVSVSGEAFLTAPGAFAAKVAEAVEHVTGRQPCFSTGGGTSDARFLRRIAPVAEFGLVGTTMHKLDERVALGDLETLTRIYEDLIGRFMAAGR